MKKVIISIFLIVICYIGYSQYPITQNLGSGTTLVKNPNYGGFQGGLIPYTFTDTTAASAALTYGSTYNGFIIYTSGDSALYFRCCGATKWQQILPSGGSSGQRAWLISGNAGIFTSPVDPQYVGTTTSQPFGLLSANVARLTINTSGAFGIGSGLSYGNAGEVLTSAGSGAPPTWAAASGGSIPISSLTAATGTNSIDNSGYEQSWDWSTLSSGNSGLRLQSEANTAATGNENVLRVSMAATPIATGITTYGVDIDNQSSGTNLTNIGLRTQSLGGSTNIGLLVSRGSTNLGTVGTESGVLNINGSTSGTITIQPQAAAGTYNFNLPTTAGTSGYLLASGGGGSSPMTYIDPSSLVGTLQTVTDLGNTTTNDIIVDGGGGTSASLLGNAGSPGMTIQDASWVGTTIASGFSAQRTASGTIINILYPNTLTGATKTQYFQDASGTIALLSDITGGISGLTTNELVYGNSATTIASLPVATYPSLTELSYVKGVTSAIQTQIDGKANTALSNLASVAINTSLISDANNTDDLGSTSVSWRTGYFGTTILPDANDGAQIGSTTRQWSDLFLAEGGVINWDNGDATLTQVGNSVTLDGAAFLVTSPSQTPASFSSSFAGNMQVNWNSTTSNNVNFVFQEAGTPTWYIGNNASVDRLHILNSAAAEVVTILQGQQVGINKTAPTARLHIGPSLTTANYGSIKVDEGSRQTTPEDGTINYVSNNLEFTETSTVYTLAKTLTNTATLNFGNTAAGVAADLTVTVTGASVGDAVYIGADNASVSADNITFWGWVSATNTVTVRFNNNNLVSAVDPASGTFRVVVTKY